MWGPHGAFVGKFVNEDANAGWRKGGAIEIEGAMPLGVGGEFGIESRAAK